ncbi:hypothetical protein BU23DRAFT_598117 [Bimuria novae-zelandiae CBS 107.79]|uniref:Uncharacterized protein n=1 Tax=Bimuria novae-zelandiae CBS 107.79 TaxID=1447943 RepID=A0A6A5VEJ0_9PLEO|nr:hypothetical protein BU23DRAFT_598117 [Bimuria novae-zelandiae CBS 107.79]
MTNPDGQKTAIASDTEGLAMNNAPKKGRKKAAPTFRLSKPKDSGVAKAPKNPPAARPHTKFTSTTAPKSTLDTSGARFFTEDGLNIPLYDAKRKKLLHARDGRIILHKSNKKAVLDGLVRQYVRDAMVDRMEKWSKDSIWDWITEVETRAFGAGPKGKTMREKEEEVAAKKEQDGGVKKGTRTSKSPVVPHGGATRMSLEMARGEEEPEGRVTRSMSEEMQRLLEEETEEGEETSFAPPAPVFKPAKIPSTPYTNSAPAMQARGQPVMQSFTPNANKKRKPTSPPPAAPQQTAKKAKLGEAGIPPPSPPRLTMHLAPPPASSNHPSRPQQQGILHSKPAPPPAQPTMPKAPPPKDCPFPWNPSHANLLAPTLPTPSSASNLAAAFNLDPSWEPTPTSTPDTKTKTTPLKVLPLPGPGEHFIVSSSKTRKLEHGTTTDVHTLIIPHADLTSQRKAAAHGQKIPSPHRKKKVGVLVVPAPFLKAGKHGRGGDFEKSKDESEDLEMGVGHQVDPRDIAARDDGRMSEDEFGRKYPGRTAGQWPCGCAVPWNEDDSEEE